MENITIEVDRTGVVAIYGDITATPFLNLIGPAITDLHYSIRDVQRLIESKEFVQMMEDAAAKLAEAATEQTV